MRGPKLPSTDRNRMRSIWKNAAAGLKKATFHENGKSFCRNKVLGMTVPSERVIHMEVESHLFVVEEQSFRCFLSTSMIISGNVER